MDRVFGAGRVQEVADVMGMGGGGYLLQGASGPRCDRTTTHNNADHRTTLTRTHNIREIGPSWTASQVLSILRCI